MLSFSSYLLLFFRGPESQEPLSCSNVSASPRPLRWGSRPRSPLPYPPGLLGESRDSRHHPEGQVARNAVRRGHLDLAGGGARGYGVAISEPEATVMRFASPSSSVGRRPGPPPVRNPRIASLVKRALIEIPNSLTNRLVMTIPRRIRPRFRQAHAVRVSARVGRRIILSKSIRARQSGSAPNWSRRSHSWVW